MTERYQILEQLGEGGAGSVYKAWDGKLQRHVAIKFLLPPSQRTAEQGTDLAREAAAIAGLQHPNVVSVYDLDTDGVEPMVVMEFINGETLEQTARRGAMERADWEKIAQEALEGLAAAHAAGMVHRDIKPGNMMFHWLTNENYQIKLLDFGLANQGVRPEHQDRTSAGTVAGSVHFMAPEQFQGHPLDVRTDLYSMGAVLHYTLTGRLPFDGDDTEAVMNAHLQHTCPAMGEVRPDLPPLLASWVDWLMKRQASDRPESAAVALKTLRGIIAGTLTELPGGRRTTAVKTVSEAPLMRDAAARTSASVPTASMGVAAPHPVQVVADEEEESSGGNVQKMVLAGAAVVVAGGLVWAFLGKKGTPEGDVADAKKVEVVAAAPVVEKKAPPPEPPLVSEPLTLLPGLPLKHLVVCLDAATPGKKNRGTQTIATGEAADFWPDIASALGNNGAQYYATGHPDYVLHQPLWVDVPAGDGLAEGHKAYSFSPERTMVLARDSDRVGDPVRDALSQNAVTWMIVLKAQSQPVDQVVIQSRVGGDSRGWETRIDEGVIRSGGHTKSNNTSYYSRCRLPEQPTWMLLAGRHDGARRTVAQWVVYPDGKLVTCGEEPADLSRGDAEFIRLGSARSGNEQPKEYFQGQMACVLLYNAALPDDDIQKGMGVLFQRYFGKALTN